MNCIYKVALAVACTTTLSACMPAESNMALEDSPSYATETALAIVNSVATDTERGTMDFMSLSSAATVVPAEFVSPLGASCKTTNPRSSCNSANQIRFDFQDCSTSIANMKGGWTNTYNNTNACQQAQDGALQSGQSVTRTSSNLVIEGYYGGSLEFSTLAHSAYDETTIPARGITVRNEGRYRSIDVAGARRTLKDKDGKTLFDISIENLNDILMTGTRANRNRQINTGTLRIHENREKYSADLFFNSVKWTQSSCCYPTSGSIQARFDGSKSGMATLAFKSTCGVASYTDADGSQKDVTLIQCE